MSTVANDYDDETMLNSKKMMTNIDLIALSFSTWHKSSVDDRNHVLPSVQIFADDK